MDSGQSVSEFSASCEVDGEERTVSHPRNSPIDSRVHYDDDEITSGERERERETFGMPPPAHDPQVTQLKYFNDSRNGHDRLVCRHSD